MRPTRSLAGWFAWLLVMLGVVSRASAAPVDIDVLEARFGFCEGLVPERWTPVRLTIASKKEPFSGVLVVTHSQDATQDARVVVPVATTPGTPTQVEVVLCVPRGVQLLTFDFIDQRSGRSKSIRFMNGSSGGAGALEQYMPPEDDSGRRVVVVDGPRSLVESVVARESYLSRYSPKESIWAMAWMGQLSAGSMPLMWAGYDSADVVVVPGDLGLRGDNRVDARAMDALMAWVRSGGRLVVLVEPAGDGWARFVDRLDVVKAADQAEVSLPPRVVRGLDAMPVPPDGEGAIAAAATLRARVLSLTDEGMRRGWLADYMVDSTDSFGNVGRVGLVASGPVGLGRVMLVGWDPTKASAVASSTGARRLWRDLLGPTLENGPVRTLNEDPNRINSWGGGVNWGGGVTGSGSSTEAQDAIDGLLTEITDVPPLGHGVFIAIAAVIIALAMLVGPIDWFALRRADARKYSWITALFWIAIASLACLVAPGMVRSEGNRVFRLAAYDAVADEGGAITHASREGIMSILPGGGGRVRLEDATDGAIQRGISSVRGYRRSYSGGTLPLRQGASEGGILRGIALQDMGVRQWNLRALLDESPSARSPALGALRIVVGRTDHWELEVKGLPPGASVKAAAVETWEGYFYLEPSDGSGAWVSRVGTGAQPQSALWTIDGGGSRSPTQSPDRWADSPGWGQGVRRPGIAHGLPLSSTRRGAINRYLQSGRWVCVHVQVLAWPSDVPLSDDLGMDWETDSQATFRVLVPFVGVPPAPDATPSVQPSAPTTTPPEAIQP